MLKFGSQSIFQKTNSNIENEVSKSPMFGKFIKNLTETNEGSIKNGVSLSQSGFYVSKDIKKDKFESIKNSLLLGTQYAGIAPLVSQLAYATGEVLQQEVFVGNKDKNGQVIGIERYIPTVNAPNLAYYPSFWYQVEAMMGRITKDNLFEGITKNAGQVRQGSTELSGVQIEQKEVPIYMYSNTLSYNELQMQTMKKFKPDAFQQGLESYYQEYAKRMRYLNLVGNSTFGVDGLLTVDALIEQDKTGEEAKALGLTKPLRELLLDQETNFATLNKFINRLRDLINGALLGYDIGGFKKPTLLVPRTDYQRLQDTFVYKTFGNVTGMQWLQLIEQMGIEVLPCECAEQGNEFNPHTGYNIYQLYDFDKDTLRRVEVQGLSLYAGFQTANGVDFSGVLTSQFVLPVSINKNKNIRFKISNS
jgi:hypothetical protein